MVRSIQDLRREKVRGCAAEPSCRCSPFSLLITYKSAGPPSSEVYSERDGFSSGELDAPVEFLQDEVSRLYRRGICSFRRPAQDSGHRPGTVEQIGNPFSHCPRLLRSDRLVAEHQRRRQPTGIAILSLQGERNTQIRPVLCNARRELSDEIQVGFKTLLRLGVPFYIGDTIGAVQNPVLRIMPEGFQQFAKHPNQIHESGTLASRCPSSSAVSGSSPRNKMSSPIGVLLSSQALRSFTSHSAYPGAGSPATLPLLSCFPPSRVIPLAASLSTRAREAQMTLSRGIEPLSSRSAAFLVLLSRSAGARVVASDAPTLLANPHWLYFLLRG